MNAITNHIHHEFLSHEEVAELTGRTKSMAQLEWLSTHGWKAEINAAGRPVVGRWYARMKLAGIDLTSLTVGRLPNFDKIR